MRKTLAWQGLWLNLGSFWLPDVPDWTERGHRRDAEVEAKTLQGA